jgi:hypothetical protein
VEFHISAAHDEKSTLIESTACCID